MASLTPYIDDSRCIRMRGRIDQAGLEYDQRHPYILPAKCTLALRLMEEAHSETLHGGVQLCMQYLRERYWIGGLRRRMKAVIHQCVRCARYRQKTNAQLMGDLPPDRVNYDRPFRSTGVDYAGPYRIKAKTGRNAYIEVKAYVAVFVCCVTRMIHLELVSDATSQAFLAALDRMIARRGRVELMRSDQGLQFVGGIRELEEAWAKWDFQELKAEVVKRQITWRFNTAFAPHQGGLWEAAVKSMKYHVRRVVGEHLLTFEEFATLLARVEGVLNSRPLTALSDEASDLTALTPAHFAIGGPVVRPLGPPVQLVPDNRLANWELLHKMEQEFSRRWQTDYLASKQARTKWWAPERNLEIGDLVFLRDDNLPPGQWLIGRIIECHAGKDGLVRNVTVQTKPGKYTRPVAKCCYLPLEPRQVKATTDNSGPFSEGTDDDGAQCN